MPAPLVTFLPFILIFVVFYFLLVLPQQRKAKQRQQMLGALKKGDKVVTVGGVLGTIANINRDTLTLHVADNVKIRVLRSYVDTLRADEEGEGE